MQNGNETKTNLDLDLKTLIDKDNSQKKNLNEKRIQRPEKYQKTQVDLKKDLKPQKNLADDLQFQKSELGGQNDIMNRMKRFENAGGKEMI